MAMTMNGDFVLPADKATVWAKLNDPDVLRVCIPGCQSLERTGDNGFAATAKIKVGPVSATFKGKVSFRISTRRTATRSSAKGEGGVAGFAKGGAVVKLEDAEGGTKLSYDVEAQIGGKLAQLGGRLINGVAKKMADEFFANFAKAVSPAQA